MWKLRRLGKEALVLTRETAKEKNKKLGTLTVQLAVKLTTAVPLVDFTFRDSNPQRHFASQFQLTSF